MFIQSPLLGSFLIRLGNTASRKNGEAKATANATAPAASSRVLKLPDAVSPVNPPRNGATQVKLTTVNEAAMNTVPAYPPWAARLSSRVASELGNVISNRPNRLRARATNSAPSRTLVTGWTARFLNVVNRVMAATDSNTTMVAGEVRACARTLVPCFSLCLTKMLTVIGTMGKTQGVSRVMSPHRAAVATKVQKPEDVLSGLG